MSNYPRNPWPFDRYSIPHFAIGVLFAASKVPAPLAVGSHIAFELVENRLKKSVKSVWPNVGPDSFINHIGDVTSFSAGFFAANTLKKTKPGIALLTGIVALGAAVWTWNLLRGHSWPTRF